MSLVERDSELVALLQNLCSPQELPRIRALLVGASDKEALEADAVTHVIVVLVDHFVQVQLQQFPEDSTKLQSLSVLAPQLERLVEADDACWFATYQDSDPPEIASKRALIPQQVRVRAARILVHLGKTEASEASANPPSLMSFASRTKNLAVLMNNAEAEQETAREHLEVAQGHGERQNNLVIEGGLTKALCIGGQRLAEFAQEVEKLEDKRVSLEREVNNSHAATGSMVTALDRRSIARGRLSANVEELSTQLLELHDTHCRTTELHRIVKEKESALRDAAGKVEEEQERKRKLEGNLSSAESAKHLAETRCTDLNRRMANLSEMCTLAPVKLQTAQGRLAELERQRTTLVESIKQLTAKGERNDHRSTVLDRHENEMQGALTAIADVQRGLEVFQSNLNSEIILTDAEIEHLVEFDKQLHPSRPERIRLRASKRGSLAPIKEETDSTLDRSPSCDSLETIEGVTDFDEPSGAPSWDEIVGEQAFRNNPNFRSFHFLVAERKTLWDAEAKWLKEKIARKEFLSQQIASQKRSQEQQLRDINMEETSLRNEAHMLADSDGHTTRLVEVQDTLSEARDSLESASTYAAEAFAIFQVAEANVQQSELVLRQAEIDAASAREAAQQQDSREHRVSADLEVRTRDLENKCRDYFNEWRSVELEERRLVFLQAKVRERLSDETKGRERLREEVKLLITHLQDLDQQLDVASFEE